MKKTKQFLWTLECYATWELIKQKYVEAPILIFLNWDVEFRVHKNASLLAIGAMLTQNLTRKHDRPIVYVSKLLNSVERNYSTIEHETLAMVFALHKFRHYLLGNKFFLNVNNRALVCLINKPQV